MKTKKLIFISLGFIYAIIFTFIALLSTGGGHGSFIFVMLAIWPFGIGFFFWPLFGFLLSDLKQTLFRYGLLALLAIHYYFVGLWWYLHGADDLPYLLKVWAYYPENIILPAVIYLSGQLFIWIKFWRSVLSARAPSNNSFNPSRNSSDVIR